MQCGFGFIHTNGCIKTASFFFSSITFFIYLFIVLLLHRLLRDWSYKMSIIFRKNVNSIHVVFLAAPP